MYLDTQRSDAANGPVDASVLLFVDGAEHLVALAVYGPENLVVESKRVEALEWLWAVVFDLFNEVVE